MRKFGTVAAVACCVTLSLWANPAQAQYRAGARNGIFARGYRGEYRGVERGSSYGGMDGAYATGNSRRLFRNRAMVSNQRYGSYGSASQPVANLSVLAGPTYVYGSDASATNGVGSASDMANLQARRSFYSPPENGNQAAIEVLVPDANAKVMFDDSKTEMVGTDRLFNSPTLNPGQTYTYTIKCQWTDKGEEVVRTAEVRVQAGRATLVDFRGKGDIHELKSPPQQLRD
jgi:uncharacterized protein (TIGR03000 family)